MRLSGPRARLSARARPLGSPHTLSFPLRPHPPTTVLRRHARSVSCQCPLPAYAPRPRRRRPRTDEAGHLRPRRGRGRARAHWLSPAAPAPRSRACQRSHVHCRPSLERVLVGGSTGAAARPAHPAPAPAARPRHARGRPPRPGDGALARAVLVRRHASSVSGGVCQQPGWRGGRGHGRQAVSWQRADKQDRSGRFPLSLSLPAPPHSIPSHPLSTPPKHLPHRWHRPHLPVPLRLRRVGRVPDQLDDGGGHVHRRRLCECE